MIRRVDHVLSRAAAVLLALGLVMLLLRIAGVPPIGALRAVLGGAIGTPGSVCDVLVAWIPLLLAAGGLLLTFSAGLWNIGIEGQITAGAIFSTGALRMLQGGSLPPGVVLALAILAGIMGGALWAGLAGALRTFGGVNEIFGGLGLNFVATAWTMWLVFGPWKRPGVGSMSGTEPFPESLWLPHLADSRLSLWALGLGVAGLGCVAALLRRTTFGLKLRAIGLNRRAALMLGVPAWQYMMLSFVLCGALAGLAGAIQVTAVYHRLIPSISSGYGFLGLLVALLAGCRAAWVAPVAFLFAALNIGSIQLPIEFRIDSSLSGVLQGLLVLFVVLADGVRRRFRPDKEASG